MAAIDGLRALAVLAVVAYHASIAEIPGGFFGVDVFFVISGYLVTVLFLARASRQQSGTPLPTGGDTLEFWRRRARRLIPAAVATAAVTWVVFAALNVRNVEDLTAEAVASLGYAANWLFLLGDQSYFETMSSPSPFRHFWSLAVEGQFYLLWPLLLMGALRCGGRITAFALAVTLAALSTVVVAGLYSPEADPSRAYYGTDARAAGLLLGAALAIILRPEAAARAPRATVEGLGWAGLAVLVALVTQVSEFDSFIYRGGFFLASSATLAVMLAALHGRNSVSWVLSRPAFRWLGERSYSIYLWHWPIFVLSQPHLSADLQSWSLLAARLGVTLILADLSYRLVEHAFRGRSGWRLPEFGVGSGPILARPWARPLGITAVGAVAIVASGGLPLRTGLADDLAAIEQQVNSGAQAIQSSTVSLVATPAAQTTAQTTDQASSPPSGEGATPTGRADAGAPPAADPTEAASPSWTPPPMSDPTSTPAPSASPTPGTSATATSTPSTTTTPVATPSVPPGEAEDAVVEAEPTPVPTSTGTAASGSVPGEDEETEVEPSATPDAGSLGASVTIIGDSVTLGAAGALQAALPGAVISAEVGRQFYSAPDIVAALEAQGALGDVVVISLGANGSFTADQFGALMSAIGDRTVLMVTVTVPRIWEGDVNNAIYQNASTYGYTVADWHAQSAGVSEYFGADGVHLTTTGQGAYAGLIAASVQQAIAGGS